MTAREIRDAVRNSAATAWKPTKVITRHEREDEPEADLHEPAQPIQPAPARARWNKRDSVALELWRNRSARSGVDSLYDLWERSPVQPPLGRQPSEWFGKMLGTNAFVCVAGDSPTTAKTARFREWQEGGWPDELALVVANPMRSRVGLTQDGRTSPRCLGNVGERRWVVLEFDQGDADEQAALHWALTTVAERHGWPVLRLAVHSGGKSLHGWYGPVESEDAALSLMQAATSLGADPATWNKCQLVRAPGGTRAAKQTTKADLPPGWVQEKSGRIPQQVYFYRPFSSPCISQKSTRLSVRSTSHPHQT